MSGNAPQEGPHGASGKGRLAALTLGALGVVYGDIGTSPLYALRETFLSTHHPLEVTKPNVLGVLSLVFWSLIVVITIKYLLFVMKADNNGEGGILALTSLASPERADKGDGGGVGPDGRVIRASGLVLLGLFGTALLYGDGMITPAISVLSAVEGVTVAAPNLSGVVLPAAVVILIALFAIQPKGTATIGKVFGPVMLVWFVVLGLLGLMKTVQNPGVLEAVNPVHAVRYFADNGFTSFLALGAIFLVVTGGEALYADMGHFGIKPIRLGWIMLVLPMLMLNYFGQGALLIEDPTAIDSPLFRLGPSWSLYPMLALATIATVVASQALISGAFSLTVQAIQLGYSPRLRIKYTSKTEAGQIYVPAVNWALMIACIGLVLGFRTSTNLAAAYGLAVTATMVITTMLFYIVAKNRFGWSGTKAVVLCGVFLIIDAAFLGANLFKIPYGGWFPLVVGALIVAALTTWRSGRRLTSERLRKDAVPLAVFVESAGGAATGSPTSTITRSPGTAVYLYSSPGFVPPALQANLRSSNSLHQCVVVTSVVTDMVPHVLAARRTEHTELGHGFHQLTLHFGFLDDPNVPLAFIDHAAGLFPFDPATVTYLLGRESFTVTDRPGMAKWRERLFRTMSRNATPAANYFRLPIRQTIDIGVQVEL